MDPVAALGLTNSIISVIGVSVKLVSTSIQVYSTGTGTTSENEDIRRVTEDLQASLPKLVAGPVVTGIEDSDTRALVDLATECRELCSDLLKCLQKLQSKDHGSKLESARVALRSMVRKSELESLQRRIALYQARFFQRLDIIMSKEQSATSKFIKELCEGNRDVSMKTQEDLGNFRNELLQAIQEIQVSNCNSSHTQASSGNSNALQVIEQMPTGIDEAARAIVHIEWVLAKLRFDDMALREHSIESEHRRTFQWLLYDPAVEEERGDDSSQESDEHSIYSGSHGDDDSTQPTESNDDFDGHLNEEERRRRATARHRFLTWLQAGSGIFYVSGKAGSGKSILMKYLYQDAHVKNELGGWAGAKTLLLAGFFFWSSGSRLQKSPEGLYRRILWKTLRACPELIDDLFAEEHLQAWSRIRDKSAAVDPFDFPTVRLAFDRLCERKTGLGKHKICFFIDGLDEYDGDCWKLAKQLKTWAASSDVKICVSARPHNEFERCFDAPDQRLRLHELTRADMQIFVSDEFAKDERFDDVKDSDPEYVALIDSIVDRSDGVFLWVRFVTQDLLNGIGNGYSIPQLREFLKSMPDGLEELFQRMFDSISKADRQRSARTFLMLAVPILNDLAFPFRIPWTSITISIIDDFMDGTYDVESLYSGEIGPFATADELKRRVEVTARRINARSRGLLQTVPGSETSQWPFSFGSRVDFVHRCVRDFLQSDHMMTELRKLGGAFDLGQLLIQSYLWRLKALPVLAVENALPDDAVPPLEPRINLPAIEFDVQTVLDLIPRLEPALGQGHSLTREIAAIEWWVRGIASLPLPTQKEQLLRMAAFVPCGTGTITWKLGNLRGMAESAAETRQTVLLYSTLLGLKDFVVVKISELQSREKFSPRLRQTVLFVALLGASIKKGSRTNCLQLVNHLVNTLGARLNGTMLDCQLRIKSRRLPVFGPAPGRSQWTPWTLLLHVLFGSIPSFLSIPSFGSIPSPGRRLMLKEQLGIAFEMVEHCLKLGADPADRFIAFEELHPKGGRTVEGAGAEPPALWPTLRFGLSQLTELLLPPNKAEILAMLQGGQASSWGLGRLFWRSLSSRVQPPRDQRIAEVAVLSPGPSLYSIAVGNVDDLQDVDTSWLDEVMKSMKAAPIKNFQNPISLEF